MNLHITPSFNIDRLCKTAPVLLFLVTDESRFVLSRADGRVRLYRRRNERDADCCVLQRDRWVWGGVQLWCGAVLPTDIEPCSSLLKAIKMPNNTGKTF